MKKKYGFTLIELLAVIVVLAIIALIATPIVTNVIEKSKKGAAIESGNNLIHSAEIYFMTTSPRYGKIDVLDPNLNYNGKKPELGEVEITKEGKTRIYAYINGYCVTKEYETETYASKTSKDNCNWYGTDNYETQEGTIFTLNNQKVKKYLIYGNSTQQTRSGKNLFNIDSIITNAVIANGTAEKITNGWKVSGNFGSASSNPYSGAAFSNGWLRPGWYTDDGKVYIEEGTTVTISADIKLLKLSENISIENNFSNIHLYGDDGVTSYTKNNSQRLTVNETKRVYQTYTVKKSGYYFPVFTVNNNELEITNIQIEEGSSATEYEGYGAMPSPEYPSEVKSTGDLITSSNCSSYGSDACNNVGKYVIQVKNTGKNLVNFNQLYSDTSKFTNNDGVITGSNRSFHEIKYKIPKEYIGKKLTLSGKLKMEGEVNYIFFLAYTGGKRVDSTTIKTKDTFVDAKVTLNVESEDDYFCISYGDYSGTVYVKDLQLELGDTVTEYESYKESITTNIYLDEPLRKVGDYADYIDFENKKVVRNVRELKLSGNETWTVFEPSNVNVYQLYTTNLDLKGLQYSASMSNIFPYGATVNTRPNYKAGSYLITSGSNVGVQLYGLTHFTVQEWKNFLKTNNAYIYYILATPTETSINLPNIETLDGNTTLFINSDIQPSNIKLTTTK